MSKDKVFPPLFAVHLDSLEYYCGADDVKAIQIHGIISGVLVQKKLSGTVTVTRWNNNTDKHPKIIETYRAINGVEVK